MADITVTPANVQLMSSATTTKPVQYGEAVAQGKAVYPKSDGKWWLADADHASAEAAMLNGGGVALTPGGANEYGIVVVAGPMDVGATLTQGEIYVLSGNAGGICPEGDLSTGERVVIIGAASAADTLNVQISYTGATVP